MTKIEFTLRFDGASRGNPGHSSYGFAVYAILDSFIEDIVNEYMVHSEGDYIGKITNNQAEYRALLEGIRWCNNKGLKNIRIEGDSELVINQVRGVWLVRDKTLKSYWEDIVTEIKDLGYVELRHIPREKNKDADKVCNLVLNNFFKKQ